MSDLQMNNNESFWTKIKKFFMNLFGINNTPALEENFKISEEKKSPKIETSKIEEKPTEIKAANKEEEFIKNLQGAVKDQKNKDGILEDIEKNPELIYTLSNKRLEQLISIYDEEIAKVEAEISAIKKQLA